MTETTDPTKEADEALDPRWPPAIIGAVLLGGLFALLSGNEIPFPVPAPEVPTAYWIGWSPLAGLFLLIFNFTAAGSSPDRRRYLTGAIAIVAATAGAAYNAWSPVSEDVAVLTAIHLPLVVWFVVGWTVWGQRATPEQRYAYLLKSVETVVAAGLFLISGAIFAALTFGVFQALGVELPEALTPEQRYAYLSSPPPAPSASGRSRCSPWPPFSIRPARCYNKTGRGG